MDAQGQIEVEDNVAASSTIIRFKLVPFLDDENVPEGDTILSLSVPFTTRSLSRTRRKTRFIRTSEIRVIVIIPATWIGRIKKARSVVWSETPL
jgi:hypothetical protein